MIDTAAAIETPQSAPGLSEVEAQRRLEQRGPVEPPASSRSYASIVRANVFTVFNLILLIFGTISLAFGEWQDALFLGVLVSNSAIGIVQEVRAKQALDRLAALVAPRATVVRDGKPLLLDANRTPWAPPPPLSPELTASTVNLARGLSAFLRR